MSLYRNTIEYLHARKRSYFTLITKALRKQPTTPDDTMALADLARFCRATQDCLGADERQTYILIGRRQVWLRITQHLSLTPKELFDIYSQYPPPKDDEP